MNSASIIGQEMKNLSNNKKYKHKCNFFKFILILIIKLSLVKYFINDIY